MDNNFDKESYDYLYYACTTFFSRKWQLSIIFYLFTGPKYFGEILRFHEGLSKKYLSTILRKLESKGVVKRTVREEGLIVRVEYSLTQQGEELKPILESLIKWGKKYNHK